MTSVPGLYLILSSTAHTCTVWTGRTLTHFAFEVPGSPLAPGTYTIITGDYTKGPAPSKGQGTVSFSSTNDCMGVGSTDYATSGRLVITGSDASHIAGTFDLTFPDGHVTGTFDAPVCNVDANAIKSDCP